MICKFPKRKLVRADWDHVAQYAQWVRKLHYFRPISSPFLNLLTRTLVKSGAHMFPSLQQLTFETIMEHDVQFVKAVLAPSITHLTLQSCGGADGLAVLSELGSLCPSLAHFRFEFSERGESDMNAVFATCDSLSRAVVSMTRLISLDVPFLRDDAFKHVSCLSSLNQLRIDVQYPELEQIAIPSSGFGSLRKLSLGGLPIETMTRILRALEHQDLGEVKLEYPYHGEPIEHWRAYFAAVAYRTSAASELKFGIEGVAKTTSDLVEADALRPLLAAHNLTILAFDSCFHLRLSDAFIEELAKASPNLIILDIGTGYDPDKPEPTLTLNAYRHVLIHCPQIKKLGLFVNTDTDLVEAEDLDEVGYSKHGEELCLSVGNSVVKDHKKLGAFFLPFFHRPMGHVLVSHFAIDLVRVEWNRMKTYLTSLIEARRQSI